ncbi:SDR family NAD(P)-dependent oxidoreductase [Hephaestia mangrovi]|uniref:SDR family NAD(P)-dependent oxidoreductase n=1 Tax=Hephaestia mangrovi TaxID=2873268 RepID=UPI001CA7A387|nr:SDR family NAD(P)-dependent oxidoreductase [Hephaestia mangrovi]
MYGTAAALAGRRAESLIEVARTIERDGRKAVGLPTDVADEQTVDKRIANLQSEPGPRDAAFNNAGILGTASRTRRLPRRIVSPSTTYGAAHENAAASASTAIIVWPRLRRRSSRLSWHRL